MARDPGSIWKPLPEAGAPDGHTKTQFIFHSTGTMASAAANWAYFARGDVVVESTFIVGWGPEDPTLQIMDSTDHADANGSANRRGISVEVVGDGVGGYNDWQISECIRLGMFGRAEHDIPPRIIPSEPEGGYGWHIMFGAPGPWTSVVGKVCPGNARIQQLQSTIFPAIFAGTTASGRDWFDMATKEELVAILRSEGVSGAGDPATMMARGLDVQLAQVLASVMRSEGVSGAGDTGRIATAVAAAARNEDPVALAAALPADFAAQVADELAKRLAS